MFCEALVVFADFVAGRTYSDLQNRCNVWLFFDLLGIVYN
jgi:hypothetical protein